jgi:amino acid adenylation domain-containing protein
LLRYGEGDYRLIWTYHHILLDGRSRRLVQREVFAYYQAFLQNDDIAWPQPRPFHDYIDWLQQQDFREHESFWRQTLKGFTAATPLGIENAPKRSGTDGPCSGNQAIKLSTEVTAALRSIAKQNGLTLATVMQGAWGILLSRYSGERDVVFGMVCSSRRGTFEGADDVIGLCINTLPIRLHLDSEIALLSWLKAVRSRWVTMRDHLHTPLVKVQSWSEVPAGHGLFSTIMSFQDYQSDAKLQKGVWSNYQVQIMEQPNYPINLAVDDGAELEVRSFFDRDRIDDDAMRRMLGHLRTLLEAIAANPDQKVGKLPLLTSLERHQLLVEWNQTEADYPRDKCVHQIFEALVENAPDAVAVTFDQSEFTYAELNAQANQLARYLKRNGVRPGSLVASYMEQSSDLIVTLLAILKSGGAYLALETNIPSKRLHSILGDARPAIIVAKTQQEKATIESAVLADGAAANLPIVVCLDQHTGFISDEATENLDLKATSEDLAYVCFTSGSSGQPKGVSIPHRAIVRLVKNITYVSLSASDVFLQFAPVSFDASTFEIWGCLLNGGRLVVLASKILSLAEIGSAIQKNRISVLWLTAGLFHKMVDYELDSLSGVRQLLAGGDVLSAAHVRKALERLREVRLFNGYGPTENTTFTCCYPITHLSAEEGSVPIGRPISSTQCFILDPDFQPVPIGVRGELFVGGDGLAHGYLNDSELTAEKFVPNPFRPGSSLYRTGDFARYRSDGNIEFLGRIDNQVKIRGYRIELGEIESVIECHPAASEAVVVAREDVPGDRRLIAYVAPATAGAQAGALRGFLKERLPAYMLPSAFVFLDVFPLTPNGKLDRKALPAPHNRSPELDASYIAPRTSTEEALASIWREVLNVKRIGVHDNFFEMGGHSLLALQLRFQIERTLEIEMPLVAIYLSPTIEGMALTVLQQKLEALDAREVQGLFAELEGVLEE